MKFLFSLVCVLILMGCEPKDNKLSRSRSGGGTSPQSFSSLKVGSYGQPIFAAQNLEQVGSLVKQCLSIEDIELEERVVRGQTVLVKSCNIRQRSNIATKAVTSSLYEKWNLDVYVEKSVSGELRVLSASGSPQKAFGTGVLKSKTMDIEYRDKDFTLSLSAQNEFKVTFITNAMVESEDSSLEITTELEATGLAENDKWTVKDLNFVMFAGGKKIEVKSQDLILNWQNTCAEFTGVMASNNGRFTDDITLVPGRADLVVKKAGVSPWSQEFADCKKRSTSFQNFEFLFY